MNSLLNIEEHPLEPFLPANAVLLMLGSFPPQKKRWSMDFFYPNLQNDMWRIVGLIFFQDKEHFLNPEKKVFDKDRIIEFLNDKGIALYDTASAIRRLQDNASDKFLEVIEQTDISLLLKQIPMCKAIVTTGQKATDIIREQIEVKEPTVGTSEPFEFGDKAMKLYRMPSSSRAYPLALEKKSAIYHRSPKPGVGSSSLSSRAKKLYQIDTTFFISCKASTFPVPKLLKIRTFASHKKKLNSL